MNPRVPIKKALPCLVAVLLALAAPSLAHAHAFPLSSEPAGGSLVAAPPPQVSVRFDNPVDPAKSSVRVLDQNGASMAAAPSVVGADRLTITTPLKPLGPGQYFVKWSALSADGDRSMGAFTFTVAPPHR